MHAALHVVRAIHIGKAGVTSVSSINNLVVTLESNLSVTQRSRIQVNTNILSDETNGTSAPLMGMADGKGPWMDILFETVIMASVLLSSGYSCSWSAAI